MSSIDLDPERERMLEGRLVAAGDGDVVLPAAWVLAMLAERKEAEAARRAFDAYRASVDRFHGREGKKREVGP